jgi:hypothetical protein
LAHIFEWMKYWLIAVNSAVSTSLRRSMISASPCMLRTLEAPAGGGHHDLRRQDRH